MSATAGPSFSRTHRIYVKSLYKRFLVNELNWCIRRDIWRQRAIEIRAEFERNRTVSDPRALAVVLEQAEQRLASHLHPDPVRLTEGPGGTKWERNLPPPVLPQPEKEAIYEHLRKTVDPNIMKRAE